VTELDQQNPQMAARTTTGLRTWRRLEPRRQAMAEQALRRIAAKQGLSNDTLEVVSKLLAAPVAVGAEAQVAVAVAA
jgi:aminopeptidase N